MSGGLESKLVPLTHVRTVPTDSWAVGVNSPAVAEIGCLPSWSIAFRDAAFCTITLCVCQVTSKQ